MSLFETAVIASGRALDLADTDGGRLWPIEVVEGGETVCFVDDSDSNYTLSMKFKAMWAVWLPRLVASPAGGRKAVVYHHWTVFENFARWAESRGYVAGAMLARKDASRGWSPENCLWVDRFGTRIGNDGDGSHWKSAGDGNSKGRRFSYVFAFGRKMTVAELSAMDDCVVSYATLRNRIASGIDPEKAATTPARIQNRESVPLWNWAGSKSGELDESETDHELWESWNHMLSRSKVATDFNIPHAGRVKAHGTRIGRARRTGRHKKLPKHKSFEPSWSKYPVFARWAVESGYRPGMRLARRDAREGWFPENCFWTCDEIRHATIEDGVLAKRKDAVLIEAFGESKTAPDWARDSRCCGVSATCIRERVKSGTWAPEDAITTPAFPRSSGMKREQFRKSVNQGEANQ